MRNSRGIEVKRGYYVRGETPNGIPFQGTVIRSFGNGIYEYRDETTGDQWSFDIEHVTQVLPPMRVMKGGVVKANPVDRYSVAQFRKDLKEPYAWPGGYPRFFLTSDGQALSFKDAKANARRIMEAIRDGDNSGWRVVAVDVNWEDDELYSAHSGERIESAYGENPTPRLKRYDQPSQRERINPRIGRPTKAPSKRLKNRRLMTHHFAPEGVWANPLTRVKLKSPAQRPAGQGEIPEKGSRLYKRRKTTQKAPAGFYANPIPKMPDPIRIDENALITPHYIGPGIYEMMPHVSDTGFPTHAKADKYAAKIADVFKKEFGFSQIVYVVKGPTSAARGKFIVTTSPGPYSIVSMWRGK